MILGAFELDPANIEEGRSNQETSMVVVMDISLWEGDRREKGKSLSQFGRTSGIVRMRLVFGGGDDTSVDGGEGLVNDCL
ncbi:hypothetical protein PIB30_049280 [Stylosanthes scabra]|uniref:Uncharacterized protein n=1 Tax=Stylosanthes scabra TaxID=79078 RepID=A0ABU6YHS6_9FABA|nr:hypothetical protein [Stylosanthes scabra]